jgi:Flp pilus assembly protein CpaB
MRPRRRVIARRRLLPRRIRHHPLVRGAAVVALVLVVLSVLQHTAGAALDQRRQWGAARDVIVARERITLGEVVSGDAVESVRWPVAMVPPDAVASSPAGRTAIATIEPGEAVLSSRLAPDGLRGVAALVPAGWRAIAIPVGPTVVALAVGDHVDLIAGFDVASTEAGESPALAVARDALVVGVDEERITVAVRDVDVARVAFAVISGTVVPALRST